MNAVVTGASRGIGKAIAMALAAEGYHLFLVATNEQKLAEVNRAINQLYPNVNVSYATCNLADAEAVKKLGAVIVSACTTIDVLVNNAGNFEPGHVYDEPEGLIEKQLNVNLLSAYHLTRALLPAMMKRKKGHIFNLCSVASLKAYPNGGAYSISKFAMDGFSKNLRAEMMEHHIKVTAIYPGAVLTDSWGNFDNSSHRIMEVNDIAAMLIACTKLSLAACVEEIVIRPQLGDL